MPLPFDATLKDLATQHPPDFLTTFDAAMGEFAPLWQAA